MNNYVPFLKLKVNEIGALSALAPDIRIGITPFFDFAKKKDMTSASFVMMVDKSAKSIAKNLTAFDTFYLDNFDIDDNILVNLADNYQYIIDVFKELEFIPVIGLDRASGRNQLVFNARNNGNIKSSTIAIRLQSEDFEDFEIVRDDIGELLESGRDLFTTWVLVLDNRVCLNTDVAKRSESIIRFLTEIEDVFNFSEVIVSGSSIPPSIRDILEVESEIIHERKELSIYREVVRKINNVNFLLGDYTVVSPLYSDVTIPPRALRNVTAPKVNYAYANVHYIARGGSLTAHARGDSQYNDIASRLIALSFFRGPLFSFGDEYLYEKGNFQGSKVTPSSILKPTINAHITYMYRQFTA